MRIRHVDTLELVFSRMLRGTGMLCTLFVSSNLFFIFNELISSFSVSSLREGGG